MESAWRLAAHAAHSPAKVRRLPLSAGGTERLLVDGKVAGEGKLMRTCPIGYTIDETLDVGWDNGTPVSEEYGRTARFTEKVISVDFDVRPDFQPAAKNSEAHTEARFALP